MELDQKKQTDAENRQAADRQARIDLGSREAGKGGSTQHRGAGDKACNETSNVSPSFEFHAVTLP